MNSDSRPSVKALSGGQPRFPIAATQTTAPSCSFPSPPKSHTALPLHKEAHCFEQEPNARPQKKKNQNEKALWASADYQAIAAHSVILAELLCERMDLRAGYRVLDIATGTGNVALAASRRRCLVVGLDLAHELLIRGVQRAESEGLALDFVAGDAERLPFEDCCFDAVVSSFGVMFAACQESAASELVRVLRSGGKLGLISWTPNGWSGEVARMIAGMHPFGRNFRNGDAPAASPFRWGTEEGMRQLLAGKVCSLEMRKQAFLVRHRSAADHWEWFRTVSPSVKYFYDGLDEEIQQELSQKIVRLSNRLNQSEETLVMPQDYLEVIAIKNNS